MQLRTGNRSNSTRNDEEPMIFVPLVRNRGVVALPQGKKTKIALEDISIGDAKPLSAYPGNVREFVQGKANQGQAGMARVIFLRGSFKDEALNGRPRIRISSEAHHSPNIQLFQVNKPYFRQETHGFRIDIELKDQIKLNNRHHYGTTIWNEGSFGYAGSSRITKAIKESIDDIMTTFINNYLAAIQKSKNQKESNSALYLPEARDVTRTSH